MLMLLGCSSKDVDPDDLPAELVSFKQTLKVKKVWSHGIGGGTENLRLALRPATDGVKIYAAAHDGKVAAIDLVSGHMHKGNLSTILPQPFQEIQCANCICVKIIIWNCCSLIVTWLSCCMNQSIRLD